MQPLLTQLADQFPDFGPVDLSQGQRPKRRVQVNVQNTLVPFQGGVFQPQGPFGFHKRFAIRLEGDHRRRFSVQALPLPFRVLLLPGLCLSLGFLLRKQPAIRNTAYPALSPLGGLQLTCPLQIRPDSGSVEPADRLCPFPQPKPQNGAPCWPDQRTMGRSDPPCRTNTDIVNSEVRNLSPQ